MKVLLTIVFVLLFIVWPTWSAWHDFTICLKQGHTLFYCLE